jgi:hypothetical protein
VSRQQFLASTSFCFTAAAFAAAEHTIPQKVEIAGVSLNLVSPRWYFFSPESMHGQNIKTPIFTFTLCMTK